jgi:hypothetical protein
MKPVRELMEGSRIRSCAKTCARRAKKVAHGVRRKLRTACEETCALNPYLLNPLLDSLALYAPPTPSAVLAVDLGGWHGLKRLFDQGRTTGLSKTGQGVA